MARPDVETTRRCGAKKMKSTDTCQQPAGFGTDHPGFGRCKWHGGCTETGNKSAGLEIARLQSAMYGHPIEVDPSLALLSVVHATFGHVAWLSEVVGQIENKDDLWGFVGGGAESYPRVEPSIWIRLYGEERDRLARVSKMALEAGVAERQMQIMEGQAELLARVIMTVLRELGVADRPEVPKVVRNALMAIETTAA